MAARATLQMDTAKVVVQNTFIHMLADEAQVSEDTKQKRSNSVPASQRFGKITDFKEMFDDADTDVSTEVSSLKGSDDSPTESGSRTPDDFCRSCTPCSVEEESPYQGSASEWPIATCTWTASAMPVFFVQQTPPQPAAAPEPKPPPSETAPRPTPLKLSSQAKAWVPNVAAAPPVSKKANKEAQALSRRLHYVIETVHAILMTCFWTSSVEVSEDALGQTLTVRVKPEHASRQQDILMLAKATISTNVSQTDLHFVGCQADPFVPMPSGVAVKVCCVKDEEKICWDLLRTGFCNYGDKCHWRHPKSEKRIAVKILVGETA